MIKTIIMTIKKSKSWIIGTIVVLIALLIDYYLLGGSLVEIRPNYFSIFIQFLYSGRLDH